MTYLAGLRRALAVAERWTGFALAAECRAVAAAIAADIRGAIEAAEKAEERDEENEKAER